MNLETDLTNNININAFYCCCIANPWLDVVEKLDNKLNIKPKYFIGWNDGSEAIKNRVDACFFQVIEDAWDGKGFPDLDYKYPLDEKLLKSISFEELNAIKMMDRLDLDRYSFSFSDRQNYFYYLLKHWLVVLDTYDINLIISPSIPHRVFDYVLYVAAKIKDIVSTREIRRPVRQVEIGCLADAGKTNYFKDYVLRANCDIELRESIVNHISQVTGDYNGAKPDYMKNQEIMLKNNIMQKILTNGLKAIKKPLKLFEKNATYYLSKNNMPYDKKDMKYKVLFTRFSNKLYLKELKSEYESISTKNYSKKYILIALHYQPEETSCPTGGAYANQELIIELLNDFLPKDIDIVVKEHKTQFHPNYEGATGRSSRFYSNVLKISNRVKFASVEDDPFELIDKAIATVTISGTIGWESVIRGTPTLVFGRAWYEDMIGVFKIKSKDDLENYWDDIQKTKNNIDKKNILRYHQKIQHFFIDAAHYKAFVGKENRDNKQNVLNIFSGIKNHLKLKNLIA